MHRIVRTKHSGQIIGSILCLLGCVALLVVFWKAWPGTSGSTNVFSALWLQILNGNFSIGTLMTFRLLYLTLAGSFFLILGIVVLALSRQIFYASYGSNLLQCPYCKNQWKARRAMGWAECPYCRKFIQPNTVRKI